MKFPVTIKNGQIEGSVGCPDGEYYLTEIGVRSTQQNSYYWHIIEILSNETGYTKDEMHTLLKDRFHIDSTKHLETKAFADYIEKIVRFASIELNIYIPDPHSNFL